MSLLRTYPIAGLVLIAVFLLLAVGCSEEPQSVAWSAADGLEHYR